MDRHYLKEALGPDIPVGSFLWEALICIDTIKDYMDFSLRLVEDRESLSLWARDMFERGKLHLVRLARERGAWVIMHSDGSLTGALDDIIAVGPNVLQSLDPMAGMDIREVKRRTYGKIGLMGNVQCSYLQAGPAEMIDRFRRRFP